MAVAHIWLALQIPISLPSHSSPGSVALLLLHEYGAAVMASVPDPIVDAATADTTSGAGGGVGVMAVTVSLHVVDPDVDEWTPVFHV